MIGTLIIVGITCALMITSILIIPDIKIGNKHIGTYWLVALLGAIILICFGFLPLESVFTRLAENSAVNPLKILSLFISMTILSVFLDEIGFFRVVASKTLLYSGNNQRKLFLLLYIVVSALTVFTSNDIIVLTFTPFICYFCKNADINPVPYLTCEFVAANSWSMMLIIGNPTNVYLATAAKISFANYFLTMALPTIAAGIVSFIMLFLLFRKSLATPLHITNTHESITDKGLLIIGLLHLALCTVLLAISGYIGLEMWAITLCFALSLFIVSTVYCLIKHISLNSQLQTLRRTPWELIPFVLSMFVLVLTLAENGVTTSLAQLLSAENEVFRYGVTSFLTANIVNNIPMSVFFTEVIANVSPLLTNQAVYATIIGSNLCALATPVGALAGIMWESLLHKIRIKHNFGTFVKNGLAISIPALFVALLVLNLVIG